MCGLEEMEGWKTIYWFEESQKSIVLKFYRQPIQFPNFEIRGSETRLGKIGFVRKNGDGSFDLSDKLIRRKRFRRKKQKDENPKPGKSKHSLSKQFQLIVLKLNSLV